MLDVFTAASLFPRIWLHLDRPRADHVPYDDQRGAARRGLVVIPSVGTHSSRLQRARALRHVKLSA
jgi:hypothetical protein